jgi:hypothetical protein
MHRPGSRSGADPQIFSKVGFGVNSFGSAISYVSLSFFGKNTEVKKKILTYHARMKERREIVAFKNIFANTLRFTGVEIRFTI